MRNNFTRWNDEDAAVKAIDELLENRKENPWETYFGYIFSYSLDLVFDIFISIIFVFCGHLAFSLDKSQQVLLFCGVLLHRAIYRGFRALNEDVSLICRYVTNAIRANVIASWWVGKKEVEPPTGR
jgi:hypothetical protein